MQRPRLKDLIEIDLKNLRVIVEYLQKLLKSHSAKRDWAAIYDKCASVLSTPNFVRTSKLIQIIK